MLWSGVVANVAYSVPCGVYTRIHTASGVLCTHQLSRVTHMQNTNTNTPTHTKNTQKHTNTYKTHTKTQQHIQKTHKHTQKQQHIQKAHTNTHTNKPTHTKHTHTQRHQHIHVLGVGAIDHSSQLFEDDEVIAIEATERPREVHVHRV